MVPIIAVICGMTNGVSGLPWVAIFPKKTISLDRASVRSTIKPFGIAVLVYFFLQSLTLVA